jgi:hypothetical protein
MAVCAVNGCCGLVFSSKLCSRHYNRLRTTGTTDDGPRAKRPLEVRFWANVQRGSPSECWLWVGKSKATGYGYIGTGTRAEGKMLSHRASWLLTHGEIPAGKVIRHLCHNRLCCNPAHLLPGTIADNVADMWERKDGPKGNARLTEKQIADIRSDSRSSRQIAPLFGVSDAHIRSVRQGRCWKQGDP